MRPRALALSALLLLLGLIVQTTLIARFRFVTPDLMMLLAISFALTALRREAVLFLAFSAGLAVDMLSSTVLGLRAAVFTIVAYAAIRTAHRVEFGPVAVAVWVGLLTFGGVALFLILGTLFGQGGLIGTGLGRRIVFVPVTNMALSFLVTPMLSRLLNGDRRGLL